jgi:ribulose-phosphate 3-epimerase
VDVSRSPLIAPSLLSADFARLAEESQRVADADWLHFDVMDAHFVPNLTFGLPVMQAVQAVSPVPLDCHLMIEDPERWAPGYAEAGARNVTVHAEALHRRPARRGPRPARRRVDGRPGAQARHPAGGLPRRPPGVRHPAGHDRRAGLRRPVVHRRDAGQGAPRAGAGRHRAPHAAGRGRRRHQRRHHRAGRAAGADVFVAGSAVYGADDPARAIAGLRARAGTAARQG